MDSFSHADLAKRYNKENLQPWSLAVVSSMTALAVFAVLLRMLSRWIKRQPLWWDDWMILFSMGWNLVVVGFIFAMYRAGMGIHADKVPVPSIIMMAKWLLVAEVLYAWNLCWTKIAVLLMYYRIFRFSFFKKMAYWVGGFVVIWGFTITFLFIFICVPVQKLWYPQLPGRCINQVGTWIANATSTILTDLIILLLPMRQVWKLQLRSFEKVALTVTFGLGFFVVFASAYRFSVLFSYTSTDPTYTLAPTVGWTSIEMSAGIVSACLPVMRPVIQFCSQKIGIHGLFSHSQTEGSTGMSASRGYDSKLKSPNGTGMELDSSFSKRTGTPSAWLDEADEDDDDVGSERHVIPKNIKLRPDHGYEYKVESHHGPKETKHGRPGSKSLHSILVQTDFRHYASKQ